MELYGNEPEAEFVLRTIMGNVLDDAGRTDEARESLLRAESLGLMPFRSTRADGLRRLTRLASSGELAVEYAAKGVELCRTGDPSPRHLMAGLCVLAVAVADRSGAKAAFDHFAEVSSILLSTPIVTDSLKGLFAIFGHTLGYYASVAAGTPVDRTPEGAVYAKPTPATFAGDLAFAASKYRPGRRAFMPAMMASYADAVGREDASLEWGRKTNDLLEDADSDTRAALSPIVLPLQIRASAFALAISGAVGAGLRARHPAAKGETVEQQAERVARSQTLLPALAQVARLRLCSDPLALAAAHELASACEERARLSGDRFWSIAALVIRASFLGEPCVADIERLESDSSGDAYLVSAARVARTLAGDLTPEQALAKQFGAFQQYSLGPGLLSRSMPKLVFTPFLATYWGQAVERARFRFVAPALVEQVVAEARANPSEVLMRNILSTLASSLRMRIPDWASEWLKGQG